MNDKEVKIIQILIAPNNAAWQGALLGLGNNGITYMEDNGEWEPLIPQPKQFEPQGYK